MNRLSKNVTRRFFQNAEGFAELQSRWAALGAEDGRRAAYARKARKLQSGIDASQTEPTTLRSEHHLLYSVLRGRDWRKGFSPCADQNRLNNGYARWAAATRAVLALHSSYREEALLAPFSGLLADDALASIRALVPKGEGYCWQADLDQADAYAESAASGLVASSARGKQAEYA